VAFLDGGAVTETASDLDPLHLHWAIGAGLRWYISAIGPLRIDFAYRLGTDSPTEPRLGRFQWFISLGEAY
jgi:outer membrane translocation and assembly module TamA